MRLDLFLVENQYYPTRSKAALAIKEGKVKVNNRIACKNGLEVLKNDVIKCEKEENQFVSRGGYKLLGAIDSFHIDLKEKTVLDIGASTGGFTDCALQHKAKKVYAYDVGHNQLVDKIRNNPVVIVKEGVNCRYLTKEEFSETIDFICMDVSFISCTKMFDSISNILENGKTALVLFKPQFEVGSDSLNRQGIVKSDKIIDSKMQETIDFALTKDLKLIGKTISPIEGGDGNKEYLLYFEKTNQEL